MNELLPVPHDNTVITHTMQPHIISRPIALLIIMTKNELKKKRKLKSSCSNFIGVMRGEKRKSRQSGSGYWFT